MIACIIGLANNGSQYEKTRHNAGEWFISALALEYDVKLSCQSKLYAKVALINQYGCRVAVPKGYINESGKAVLRMMQFYKLKADKLLIVHDDIDLPAGICKLKFRGGSGGHNGLKDIIATIGGDFYRLRIGIGHPGHRDQVVSYVLGRPNLGDKQKIDEAIFDAKKVMPLIFSGNWQQAVLELHSLY